MSRNGDFLSDVRPGQSPADILLDHRRLNAWNDGARFARRSTQGLLVDRKLAATPNGIVWVRNETGADRDEFNIVAFEEPVFTRADNDADFPHQHVFSAIEPDWPTHFLSWGVLLEPVRENAVGRCMVSGVTVAQVNFANSDASTGHKYATVKDATKLDSAPCGPARILYVESPGTGDKWCKLWLGAPMPSGFLARTPGGGISAASGTNFPYTPGSGACDVAKWSGSTLVDAGWNMTVYNSVDSAVGASLLVMGTFDEVGRPWVNVEPCP